MANGSPVGRAVLTAVAVLGFFVFVAIAINTYDTDEDVQAISTTPSDVSSVETSPQPARPAAPPVGGVATGGGGTAAGSASLALPVFGGLASLALLAVAWMRWRPGAA